MCGLGLTSILYTLGGKWVLLSKSTPVQVHNLHIVNRTERKTTLSSNRDIGTEEIGRVK